jgi:phosphatidate cytidylyltransferase
MGTLLIALTIGMLAVDDRLASADLQAMRWFPFLFLFQLVLAILGCRELIALCGTERPPYVRLCYFGVLLLWLASTPPVRLGIAWSRQSMFWWFLDNQLPHWFVVIAVVAVLHLAIFLVGMASYREPGDTLERMARTWWIIAYVGFLPTFLVHIRWMYNPMGDFTTSALALAIFVPKFCDIGAYTVGRLFGRHKMAPVLSPGKTWEGAVGGLVFAVGATMLILFAGQEWFHWRDPFTLTVGPSYAAAIAFGLTVGAAGMLGDLAESLLKRDCQRKDASAVMPGFGGVLDVVDSVIFAAPVSYLWFFFMRGWK